MNRCNELHESDYKITYKGAKGSDYQPVWFVCELCHEKRIFGTAEQIVKIEKLT